MNETGIVPTLFECNIADEVDTGKTVSRQLAQQLMDFFKQHPLFNWKDINNGCEARADAICVLLQEWGIPHFKGWVFSGWYLKKHVGALKQNWNYHVAPLLPVSENGSIVFYMIDPATGGELQTLYDWAAGETEYAHSYHLVKEAHWYIFSDKKITRSNWNARNRQNRKWMIQGLAGVNSLNAKGKAALVFNKGRIKNRLTAFEQLKRSRPF
jgi:Glutaminase